MTVEIRGYRQTGHYFFDFFDCQLDIWKFVFYNIFNVKFFDPTGLLRVQKKVVGRMKKNFGRCFWRSSGYDSCFFFCGMFKFC